MTDSSISHAKADRRRFVVATPFRTVCDDNARALEQEGRLRFIALGTLRGTAGIPAERTRLNPAIGLAAYVAATLASPFRAESFRYRLHPLFDVWTRGQLTAGNHIISSYGYANASFAWARKHGGKTFLDGGNSHPENFWALLSEEHRRWRCPLPPVVRHHYARACAMMEDVDFVLSPSRFVARSFIARGFQPQQILENVYPLDLSCFRPSGVLRPTKRPLTVICTGSLSLRKGTPYLLEAFRLILRSEPSARLLLTNEISETVRPVLREYSDLPIDWSPTLQPAALAERLRSADVFVLPSLEDGFARTVAEALACGVPVVTTANTGASDLILENVNGSVVPIRDPAAIAEAVLRLGSRVRERREPPERLIDAESVSFDRFAREFLRQLGERGVIE